MNSAQWDQHLAHIQAATDAIRASTRRMERSIRILNVVFWVLVVVAVLKVIDLFT
jgi:hypothetical protein